MQNTGVSLTPNIQLQTKLYNNHGYVAYQRGYGIWRTPKPEQLWRYYPTDVVDRDDCDCDKNCEFSKLRGNSRTCRHIKTYSRQFNRKKSFKIWTLQLIYNFLCIIYANEEKGWWTLCLFASRAAVWYHSVIQHVFFFLTNSGSAPQEISVLSWNPKNPKAILYQILTSSTPCPHRI